MKTKYYTLSALVSVALLPVVGYAQGQQPSSMASDVFLATEKATMGLSIEGFYGSAQKDLLKEIKGLDKVDVAGINARMTYPMTNTDSVLVPELFFLAGIQGGSVEESAYYLNGDYSKYDFSLVEFHAAVGGNLRLAVCDWFSLVGRVQVGLSWESVEADNSYREGYSHGSYNKTESDIGLLYGCGLGAEFKIGQGALVLGADYIGSTAAPEFSDEGEKFKCEKQSYVTYSVGYKFFF